MQNNKGFTLIETLVSLLILSLVITSVITLLSSSIFSARYAKNEIKAIYKAQEGVDYIRNLRDSIAFLQNDWLAFSDSLDVNCGTADGCIINKPFTTTSFVGLSVTAAPTTPLLPGEFRNVIKTECVDITSNCDELKIESTVYWQNGQVDKSRTLKASLTRWN